ncbi:MAG: polysaccharide biosynthesis protein [Gammaproteobacteria bacterium]|nr:polysaccharide biosynthesis protein [Gammaproteobacteria bacterium]MBU2058459.1 polysaccharide biosynthesis protein [Gammaproteobacteria bacterium]MBU2176488.1 polysaccharide biosynthesis protein [Gammaproteobacteria bacterium]MBU2248570.1 polysaccharide biosynthesis protein [Gammaproteobacteria bacterium]MBU2345567.1 polysaccharide biosynthesis protein [Gammaproteobacteria bacterium]
MTWMMSLPRSVKRGISVLSDTAFLLSALFLASWLSGILQPAVFLLSHSIGLSTWLVFSITVFYSLGLYRAILRYMAPQAVATVSNGVFLSSMGLVVFCWFLPLADIIRLVLCFAVIAVLLIGGSRWGFRSAIQMQRHKAKSRVLIYGAGCSGRQLLYALQSGDEYKPVIFVDDNTELQKTTVCGLTVLPLALLEKAIQRYRIDRVLLAMPSAGRGRKRELLELLSKLPVPIQSIPGMADLVAGHMKIDDLQDIRIEDLLGREVIEPDQELLQANIRNKVVMVTGAGGSIGSELCRQIIRCKPDMLVLFDVSEFALYSIERELNAVKRRFGYQCAIKPVLGSVQQQKLLEQVMTNFQVHTVYHAAAYKHVPLVEYNMVEGVRNNVFGTWACAEAAITAKVENFVLISTDKAVRPTNVMGASKRMAELVLQGLASRQIGTRMCMVRFGNVLGSSGSVVPLFAQQIKAGGPVTLTHKEITRFFMTIPEASQLVIQAGAMAKGGEVFVLDMGEPVRIYDLATRMIHLAGLKLKDKTNPNGDIEIQITGLRPGEKLYEELLIGNNESKTEHARIRAAKEQYLSWSATMLLLNSLDVACQSFDQQLLRQILLDAPIGFAPSSEICDLLFVSGSVSEAVKKELVH